MQLLRRTQDISGQLARVRKQGADLARANLTDKVADNRKQQERLSVRVQVSKRRVCNSANLQALPLQNVVHGSVTCTDENS